jgi:two-component system sensor kinase FixL
MEVFNGAAARLFGYSASDVLGKNVSMLMAGTDRDTHDGYLERYERTGVPHIIGIGREVRARRNDGSTFCALLSVGRIAKATPPRYVGFLQDQTMRKQALAAAVQERDRANGYLEAAQTILLALDLEGRVTLINRKGCEVLGLEEGDLLGKDWFDCALPSEERDAGSARFRQFLASSTEKPYYSESHIQIRDGRRRLIAWRYVAVADPDRAITGILCSGDDVTDARRAEADARDSRERMMHVSRLVTMGEMAAGIAHELNQPLAAITTYAQAARRLLAADGDADEDVSDALEQIAAQALRAGEIIRRLRHLVRTRETQRESTQINTLIQEFGTPTRADARLHDVRVRLELLDGLPELELDSIQIQQVVLNLVRNAVQSLQHSDSAEREVVIGTGLADDGDVEITVRDTGSGVAVDMLDRLFLPFATTKSDGTGLGLAISRGIIEAHKGALTYEPNTPRGACFRIRLPVLKESAS